MSSRPAQFALAASLLMASISIAVAQFPPPPPPSEVQSRWPDPAAPQECAHATGAARTAGALSRPDTRSDTEAAGRPASEARGNGFH